MRELALFAGAGGGILGGTLLGWQTVCAVEFAEYPRRVLLARQRDGLIPPFPIWDDVRTFDGKPWNGYVDVVSGGFPCQDISVAGSGAGLEGERSGLWSEMARIIGEVRPRFAFVENSPMLTSRGLGRVLGDLAAMGFDARWGVFSACSVGAPHTRERMFIVADADGFGRAGHSHREHGLCRRHAYWKASSRSPEWRDVQCWLESLVQDGDGVLCTSELYRMGDGLANRLDRLRAVGNGQVPAVVELAWRTLT